MLYVAALALIASNLVPLAGVLHYGWNLSTIMILFWLDNLLVGAFAAARMNLARVDGPNRNVPPEARRRNASGFAAGFFFFSAIHGLFVLILFGMDGLRGPELWIGFGALAASRVLDFLLDYVLPKAYLATDGPMEGGKALVRIIVLQFVLLGGGFAIGAAKQPPVAWLVLLVALKTAGDLVAFHLANRRTP